MSWLKHFNLVTRPRHLLVTWNTTRIYDLWLMELLAFSLYFGSICKLFFLY